MAHGDAPVFVTGALPSAVDSLAQGLRADTVAGRRIVSLAASANASLAVLAMSLPSARFIHVAADADEPTPPQLTESAPDRWRRIDAATLLADPRSTLRAVCAFAGLTYDQAMLGPLEAMRRSQEAEGASVSPFASVFTPGFAEALAACGGSLLVSTYQSHRLASVRAHGGGVNTHFRAFEKPMGIAHAPGRIALGTRTEVWDLRDMPEAAARLDPAGVHDACYLPRNRHVTGDIAVHDMAFAGGELWLVATAFSCLATLDAQHSFVPRWAPPFITRLAPEDRCHLNGMAVVDDRVALVTALGTADTPGAWRANKAAGGVLIDVASSEFAAHGLSMPHSPRWHAGRLWLLESGQGRLCVADLDTGTVEPVAELPGFTRGLAFAGSTAFVGLSQIRESSTFGDLPLTQRLAERQSGIWAVDIRSGAVIGFLRFDDLVQEIFEVAVLDGVRHPEIAEPGSDTAARSYALP